MKNFEIRNLNKNDINKILKEKRIKLKQKILDHNSFSINNPISIKILRKEIARFITIINEKKQKNIF